MGRVYAVSPIGSPSRSGRSVVQPRMQATIHLRRRLLLARLQFERRRLARPRYLRDRQAQAVAAPGQSAACGAFEDSGRKLLLRGKVLGHEQKSSLEAGRVVEAPEIHAAVARKV